MSDLCKHVQTSINDRRAHTLCDRIATVDGYCARHHPDATQAVRNELQRAIRIDKAEKAYDAACLALMRCLADRDDALKVIANLEPELVAELRWKKAKLRRVRRLPK